MAAMVVRQVLESELQNDFFVKSHYLFNFCAFFFVVVFFLFFLIFLFFLLLIHILLFSFF